MARSSSKRNSASARASSVLPTPVGPRKRKRPDGAVRIPQAGPGAADRVGHRLDRLVLADHALRGCCPPCAAAAAISLSSILETGMPVQLETTCGDVLVGRPPPRRSAPVLRAGLAAWSAARSSCVLALGDLAVADLGGPLQVALALGSLGLGAQLARSRSLSCADRCDQLLLVPPVRASSRRTARCSSADLAPRCSPSAPWTPRSRLLLERLLLDLAAA